MARLLARVLAQSSIVTRRTLPFGPALWKIKGVIRRDARSAAVALALAAPLGACAVAAPKTPDLADRRARACAGDTIDVDRSEERLSALQRYPSAEIPDLEGARVVRIEVEGLSDLPKEVVLAAMETAPGKAFDAKVLSRDVLSLFALDVFRDIGVEAVPAREAPSKDRHPPAPTGILVTVRLREKPFVDNVFVEGALPGDLGWTFLPARGDLYEPTAVLRVTDAMRDRLVRLGHLDAAIEARGIEADERHVDVCLTPRPGPAYKVREVRFEGNEQLSDEELRGAVRDAVPEDERETTNCRGGKVDMDLLERATLFLSAYAYDRGLLSWEAGAPALEKDAATGTVDIVFHVSEGPVFPVAGVTFSGDLAAPLAAYTGLLRVAVGEPFSRNKMMTLVARADELHAKLGRSDLGVTPDVRIDGDGVWIDLRIARRRAP